MANQEIKLELDVTQTLSATDQVAGALGGLHRVLDGLGVRIRAILTGADLIRFLGDAAEASGLLEKELLVMRLALGKLKVAWGQALAPVAKVVLPVINDAIFALIRMVRYVGAIIAALFGFETGSEAAAAAQDALRKSVNKTSKAVKRTVASFDQLNRLNGATGAGGASSSARLPSWDLDENQIAVVERIKAILEPLQKIDLQPLTDALTRLWEAMQPLVKELFSGLEWAWYNIFAPMAKWSAEQLLPAFVDTLTAAVKALHAAVTAAKPMLSWLWENLLLPMAQWTGNAIIGGLQNLQTRLTDIAAWMAGNKTTVSFFRDALKNLGDGATTLGSKLTELGSPLGILLSIMGQLCTKIASVDGLWETMPQAVKNAWTKSKTTLESVYSWLKKNVLDPVRSGAKSLINGIIGFVNSLISGVVSGINAVVKAVNKMSFTVPSWVPTIGGQKFGFNMKTTKPVAIPYLAKGAVLPANKPFLAMVGDQRHGTNVEAPLSTIQEAVAAVMEDMIASSLAGQEAVVGVLRQILEAVLGIHIGDGDIARAVDRYRRSMAVVSGI